MVRVLESTFIAIVRFSDIISSDCGYSKRKTYFLSDYLTLAENVGFFRIGAWSRAPSHDGEHRCYQIFSDLTRRLQGLGHLPTTVQRLEAHLTHKSDDLPNVSDLQFQLQQIRLVAKADSG